MTAMTRRWGWAALALPLVLVLLMVGLSPARAAYSLSPTTGLKYYAKTNASVTVTWTRQSGINRYAIQYSKSSSFSNPKYSVPTNVKTQADAFRQIGDLEPATKYYFRIRATYSDGSNASDWSSSINITTSTYAFSAPSKPTISNVLSDRLDLSWSEVPNAGKYRVRYSTSSSFSGTVGYDYPIDNKTTITGLSPTTTYYFQVRALEAKADDAGNPYLLTSYSSSASASTNTFTAPPPQGFALEGSSKGKIVLKWKAVAGADGYRIQGALDTTKRYLQSDRIPASAPGTSISPPSSDGIVTATMTKFCDSGLAPSVGTCSDFQPGKTYIFRVTALKSGERISDYTASSGLKVVASSMPLPAPNALKVVASTENSVTLSWTKVPGATSYRLQQSKSSTMSSARYLYDVCRSTESPVTCLTDGDTITVKLTGFDSNSAGLTEPINANTSYYYKITAQGPGGAADSYPQFEDRASDYTTTAVKATTAQYPFKAPALSKVDKDTTASSVKLNWDSLAGQAYFALDRSKDTAFAKIDKMTCLPANGVGPQETTQTGLTGETTYYFRIRVASSNTCGTARSDNSAPLSARTTASVGEIVGDVNGPADALTSMVATAYAGKGPCSEGLADVAGTARVASNGNYTIDGLRSGYYCVLLSQVDDTKNYTSPWVVDGVVGGSTFDERQKFMQKATAYYVSPGVTQAVQATSVAAGTIVNGTVKSGSTPLPNVRVTVTAAPEDPADTTTREVRTVVTTDGEGKFRILGLMGGKYKLVPTKSGYKGSSYWYNEIRDSTNIYALTMAPS